MTTPEDQTPAPVDPMRSEAERVARYAEAIRAADRWALPFVIAPTVVAVADEEHAALVADFEDRLAAVQDEYRKAAESWDRTHARLNDEIELLRGWEARSKALVAEVERLRDQLRGVEGDLSNSRIAWSRTDAIHKARAEAAEAKVARVEAPEFFKALMAAAHRGRCVKRRNGECECLDDLTYGSSPKDNDIASEVAYALRAALADAPAEQWAEGGA